MGKDAGLRLGGQRYTVSSRNKCGPAGRVPRYKRIIREMRQQSGQKLAVALDLGGDH